MSKNILRLLRKPALCVLLSLSIVSASLPAYALSFPVRYSDRTASLSITKKTFSFSNQEGGRRVPYQTTYYVAHLQLKKGGYGRFRGGKASSKNGETTPHFAKRMNAILAVNGDYSWIIGYPCVKNGVVFHNASGSVPAVYNASTGKLQSLSGSKYAGLKLSVLVRKKIVTETFCFGGAFLVDGKITTAKDNRVKGGKGRPRAFIGTTGKAGDLYLIASEGADSGGNSWSRSDGVSYGLTAYQCALILKKLGCRFGVPLDGGGSVQMVYKNQYVNHLDRISWNQYGAREIRKVSDFYYFK